MADQLTGESAVEPPGFGIAVLTILLPVILMLLASACELALPGQSPLLVVSSFLGHPAIALLIAVLFASYTFGFAGGSIAISS